MQKIFCFGEALLRFSPVLGGEWIKHNNMPFYIGGAELNVAAALARWQVPVAYGTALPDNYLSKEIIAFIEQKGIVLERRLIVIKIAAFPGEVLQVGGLGPPARTN